MDIKGFRLKVDAALAGAGLERTKIYSKQPTVWALPGEVVRFFGPDAQRRPWGFELKGIFGLEIPELRDWLREHKGDEQLGIFKSCFMAFYSTNEPDLWFSVDPDQDVPAASWAKVIVDRLSAFPATIDDALYAYDHGDKHLGLLTWERHPWEFLRIWREKPEQSLQVPRRLPNGRVV